MNSILMGSQAAILPFDTETDPSSLGTRWSKWIQRYDNFLVAMNIVNDGRKKALLLHLAGERVHDIYDTFAETDDDYNATKTKLNGYFSPKKNTQYLVYKFRKAMQQAGENLDTYHTQLRMLAKDCEFADTDSEIKAQLIQSCSSSRVRRRALREPEMTLEALLNFGRTLELSEQQAVGIEQGATAAVNALEHKQRQQTTDYKGNRNNSKQCRNCGGRYPHNGDCPAKGKECNICGKLNHYAKVCRMNKNKSAQSQEKKSGRSEDKDTTYGKWKHTRKVNQVTTSCCAHSAHSAHRDSSSSEDDQYVFAVNGEACTKHPQTHVRLNDIKVGVLIDSGASVNIISETVFNTLEPKPTMRAARIKIFSYGSDNALPITGVFECSVQAKDRNTEATFYVLKGNGHTLLSYDTASKLGLIKIINSVDLATRSVADELIDSYPELFTGIGKLKDFQVKLHINPDIQPTCQPHRRVPFHVRQKVEEELKRLEDDDIIEQVTGPTPWVSPIVTPPKPKDPDKVRICVDMRQANVAVQRERHLTPTMDDVIHELNGARFFSKLDLNKGYHQLELHPDSRYITTFTTHLGLRRYKRLSFGISSAAEAMTLEEIKTETLKDNTLQQVSAHIKNDTWHRVTDKTPNAHALRQYRHVSTDLTLSASEDIILRGNRIVMPLSLQQRVLELAHESHQGIAKTKALLREKVWFPNIDQQAEALSRNCLACQATTPITRTEPLKMSELPEAPWHSVSADFYGPLPSGEYLLVIVDDYTRYPVVNTIRSTSANVVVPSMDSVFAMFGIPRVVRTDNGPPFNGSQFAQFASYMGFHHRKITPLWPQANATAERFMRTLGKIIRIAPMQGLPWKQQLNIFLREYRSTPHCTTGRSPAELMFQRPMNTKIPSACRITIPTDSEVRKRDTEAKSKMKACSDNRRHATPSNIVPGDTVLCRQPKQNKLTPPYRKEPLPVTSVKGSMVTAGRHGYAITRNSSFFKKIHPEAKRRPLPHLDPDMDPDLDDNEDAEPALPPPRYPVRQHRQPPAYLLDYD
ncbi:hypothetical protein N1851_028900 [Merluccius polli]|uniref:Gypsy retrotransposon integrase-like protein 1 n=1 Tax=Merluccius polli TaxID=89951 RepID=A0AA47M822_MERPO|nr:hypothetical protein N1851_028900 [Merluccius polli]